MNEIRNFGPEMGTTGNCCGFLSGDPSQNIQGPLFQATPKFICRNITSKVMESTPKAKLYWQAFGLPPHAGYDAGVGVKLSEPVPARLVR